GLLPCAHESYFFRSELRPGRTVSKAVPYGLSAKAVDEEIHEASYLRREMTAGWIERVHPLLWRRIVGQQPDQTTCTQVIADHERRKQDDAAASYRGCAQNVCIVREIAARHRRNNLLTLWIAQVPFTATFEIGVLEAVVVHEIVRRL